MRITVPEWAVCTLCHGQESVYDTYMEKNTTSVLSLFTEAQLNSWRQEVYEFWADSVSSEEELEGLFQRIVAENVKAGNTASDLF